jgi:sugar-specific transcriptional regulator TrmB
VVRLSLKKLLETLAGFGFKQPDARIYVFLAKKGPHTGKDLALALAMPKWQLYQSLRRLEAKGTVIATSERPALFSAIPFEKVIDLVVKAKIEGAQRKPENKDQAILDWKLMMEEDSNFRTRVLQRGERR